MEKRQMSLGNIGHKLIHLSWSSFLRVSSYCWRYPKARRTLFIAGACFVYFFFAVQPVSHTSDHQNRRYAYWTGNGVFSMRKHASDSADETRISTEKTNGSPTPTRSNVVYITLRSKRHKPAILRGTVRPKLRGKKLRKVKKQEADTHDGTKGKPAKDEWEQKRTDVRDTWKQIIHNAQSLQKNKVKQMDDIDYTVSSIRIYSQRAPPWFSKDDIADMRFLAGSKITHLKSLEPKDSPPVLLFNSAGRFNETVHKNSENTSECIGDCGVIKRPVDMSEVFAFHLDRVLGLNRSLPTVSRRFRIFDGQLCPVSLWEAAVRPVTAGRAGTLTWAEYQASLKHRFTSGWTGTAVGLGPVQRTVVLSLVTMENVQTRTVLNCLISSTAPMTPNILSSSTTRASLTGTKTTLTLNCWRESKSCLPWLWVC
ncbi:Golgi-associated kinase 1B isoform X2 [Electrophorus electricus]|uniref:Golgi-associated kinase 1B isoform X2 n=1 Tax=Electrophorus electricus TaxID=8005 RepID=UPI0015CFDB6F|nr:Golgi-associated kinase 1B isoform X2 [Electrophorus electricus]